MHLGRRTAEGGCPHMSRGFAEESRLTPVLRPARNDKELLVACCYRRHRRGDSCGREACLHRRAG